VVEKYPLYSKADEALYMLGQSYEAEIKMTKSHPDCVTANPPRPVGCIGEGIKARLADDFSKKAAETYSRILTRYPVMDRSDDAKARLIAMHQPVPRPTKAALAQNKAEEDSRRESNLKTKVIRGFSKHPDVAQASRVGDPPLVDPEPVSAKSVVEEVNRSMVTATPPATGKNGASVEMIGTGAPPPGEDAPRSDAANPPAPPAVPPEPDAAAAAPPASQRTDSECPGRRERAEAQCSGRQQPSPASSAASERDIDRRNTGWHERSVRRQRRKTAGRLVRGPATGG
jgi:hypothetical protein